jgi:hypothetical protein
MGLNTACIIRNDFLNEIEEDAKFGKKIADAVRYASHPEHAPYHGQGFDVLPCTHADYLQVVVVGGNLLRRLGSGYGGPWTADDAEVLRVLADQMGFKLVKKGGR